EQDRLQRRGRRRAIEAQGDARGAARLDDGAGAIERGHEPGEAPGAMIAIGEVGRDRAERRGRQVGRVVPVDAKVDAEVRGDVRPARRRRDRRALALALLAGSRAAGEDNREGGGARAHASPYRASSPGVRVRSPSEDAMYDAPGEIEAAAALAARAAARP